MAERGAPAATEQIILPRPSLAPAFLAIGVAVAVVGAFAGWVYSAIGGAIALIALLIWVRSAASEFSALPRRQRIETAVLPAASVRRTEGS
jgi:hypothetical protein